MAGLTSIITPVTDFIGITDSKSGKRAKNAMDTGMANANIQLDADLESPLAQLEQASSGRDFGQNLDKYNTAMGDALGLTRGAEGIYAGQQDAGDAANVRNYLNPMMDDILSRTGQIVQGGAGASLQSSATNKDMSSAIAQRSGDLWQQAFSNAMSDASNNMNVARGLGQGGMQESTLAGQTLAANNQPMEDLLSLQNDRAMQRYAANTGMTQADMALAGQKNTIL
jgi:hypothetical protein